MGAFDGIGALMVDTFGGTVSVAPPSGAPFTVTGILRQRTTADDGAAGHPHWWRWGTLHVPADASALPIGSIVTGTAAPGRTFRVRARIDPVSPAFDALIGYDLEDVT